MRKRFLRLGAFLALISVALGAFASHGLQGKLTPEQIETFQTGVRYQFYHTFALLFLGLLFYRRKTRLMVIAGYLFLAGIICFSGSLYLLSAREWLNLDVEWLGPVTPIGGVLFLLGWALFLLSTYQDNEIYRAREQGAGVEE